MNKFNELQMSEFFSSKKNVKAVKEMRATLENAKTVFLTARNDLAVMEDKADDLKRAFNVALNDNDFEEVSTLLESNKELIEYINVYAARTVESI